MDSPILAPKHIEELADLLASLRNRPYDFVMTMFPWGEPGTELEYLQGPVGWQKRLLLDLQAHLLSGDATKVPFRAAMKSGHDVGKSALLCLIEIWGLSTATDTRGRCTANTQQQLSTVLWVELAKWYNLFLGKALFKWTATRLCSADPSREETWRIDAMPWSIENPTAFAGLHNYHKRLIYIMDEGAGIPDEIWNVVDGVMREADTELIWLVASQPVYNTGRFFECFHKFAPMWHTYTVDSREVPFGNQAEIAKEIEARGGEQDDIVRVRIRGEFPLASTTQLIPADVIRDAMIRPCSSQPWEPLILGIDVARFGDNDCCAVLRRGRDARTLPFHRWRPPPTSNATENIGEVVAQLIAAHSPSTILLDATGYGQGVLDFLHYLGHSSVVGINFGSKPSYSPGGVKVLNKRAEMYCSVKEWLRSGGCIPEGETIESELLSIQYSYVEVTGELKLTSKQDMRSLGLPSPDWADALALTFALPTANALGSYGQPPGQKHRFDYDPLDPDRILGTLVAAKPRGPVDSIFPGSSWRPN